MAATAGTIEWKHARAEQRLSWVRLAVILFNSAVFLLSELDGRIAWLGYTVIVVSGIYSLSILLPTPLRQLPLLRSAYFTTAGDSVLVAAWIVATGGASSPFYVLWFVSLAAVSLRFDLRSTVVTSVIYAVLQCAIVAWTASISALWQDTIIQAAYIIFVGFIAGFAAQFWMDESFARLEATTRMTDARAAERRFRGLLDFSPEPIVVADATRQIAFVNARAEATFGSTRDELRGSDLVQLVAPSFRDTFSRWYAAQIAAPSEGPATFAGIRGKAEFHLEVQVSTFDTEDGRHLICVMRDITERLAAEEARALNAERLREIERLQEIDRFKTQFINMAAHELGTPLTPIKMQVHILQGIEPSRLEPKHRRALDILQRNVNRLADLVQDVLDVARAQADRLGIAREPVDLNRLVVEAVESFEESARHAGISLRSNLAPNLVVQADGKRLTQVLFNLLSNATKFSPSGSTIEVATARRDDRIEIRVKDNGIGIAKDQQSKLFRPFSQLQDPKQRTRAGSGLGLYISKRIVELHGGDIRVESAGVNQGTTFTIELPANAPPARESERVDVTARDAPTKASKDDLQKRIDELI